MSDNEKAIKNKQIAEFLGVQVLTPLDDRNYDEVSGGQIDHHDHDNGDYHSHNHDIAP